MSKAFASSTTGVNSFMSDQTVESSSSVMPTLDVVQGEAVEEPDTTSEGATNDLFMTGGTQTDLSMSQELKVPIVGYEIMEQRARFTVSY